MTAFGKLKCVREKIFQDLIQALRICVDCRRQMWINQNLKGNAFAIGDMLEGTLNILPHLIEANFTYVDGDSSGFDLG